jgi:hypothetical protein
LKGIGGSRYLRIQAEPAPIRYPMPLPTDVAPYAHALDLDDPEFPSN